jgi:hypothetical protein
MTAPGTRPGRYGATDFRWFDVVIAVYMAATGALFLLLGFGREGWLTPVLFHFGHVAIVLELIRASQRHPDNRVLIPR